MLSEGVSWSSLGVPEVVGPVVEHSLARRFSEYRETLFLAPAFSVAAPDEHTSSGFDVLEGVRSFPGW